MALFTSRIGEPAFFGIPLEGGSANQAKIKVSVEPHLKNESSAIAAAVQEKIAAVSGEARFSFGRASLLDLSGLETNLELTVAGRTREGEKWHELAGKLASTGDNGVQSLMEEEAGNSAAP